MRQVIRRVIDRKGKVLVTEYPAPHLGADQVLVQNLYTLISTGTEMSTLAKTPGELIRQTLADPWMRHVVKQTVFSTGVTQTARRVWQEMIMPREIGYSGAGRVLALGDQVEGFRIGGKVAYAATGHAEIVAPTVNHIVPVPESVDTEHAAFVTVGGIAIQALRRAELQFGEVVAIYGLGLVGQLASMIAKAAGCVVVGIEVDDARNRLAADVGADVVINPQRTDLVQEIATLTEKRGVDATIICASSKSNSIINSSMEITRRQGRVVIVGYVDLDVHPKNFLYREIDLRYSRAYGPGSYHRAYENGRVDYPFGYVRWTEKRNLAEFIRLLGNGSINPEPLIGGTFQIQRAQEAFDSIANRSLPGVAALLAYPDQPSRDQTLAVRPRGTTPGKIGISIIGCGNHVLSKHLPNLQKQKDVEIRALASATGKNASIVVERVKATMSTTNVDDLLADDGTDAVMICSSQPQHADHILRTISSNKSVFVEKPMVTKLEDFGRISAAMENHQGLFSLGLNRRYSPMVEKLQDAVGGEIDSLTYYVTPPNIPADHWTLDPVEGAGRLVTEGEHFLDLCHFLVGQDPLRIYGKGLGTVPDDLRTMCNFAVSVHYENAIATVVFNESGAASHPREQIVALSKNAVVTLDDFDTLTVFSQKRKVYRSRMRSEMGHKEQLVEFIRALKGEPNRLLGWREASRATLSMFAAQESIRSGKAVDLCEFSGRLGVSD